jgi:hypothetical protein
MDAWRLVVVRFQLKELRTFISIHRLYTLPFGVTKPPRTSLSKPIAYTTAASITQRKRQFYQAIPDFQGDSNRAFRPLFTSSEHDELANWLIRNIC